LAHSRRTRPMQSSTCFNCDDCLTMKYVSFVFAIVLELRYCLFIWMFFNYVCFLLIWLFIVCYFVVLTL
jgi:hypothetical protein